FNSLFPERFPDADPIVPGSGTYKRMAAPGGPGVTSTAPTTYRAPASAPPPAGTLEVPATPPYGPELMTTNEPAYTGFAPHPDNGSNNWAVTGALSNTGKPLLASDPHLSLTLPSIWSEVQIHYPGVNARGVSLPGAPGIMIGFNDHIAYGETNVGHDVTDWFKIEWTDSTRTNYLLDGEAVAATIVVDTIFVRGAEPIIQRTPWTIFGPVPYTEGRYADYAMRYLAHDAPGGNLRSHALPGTFLQLMAARNYADYRKALMGYADPAQNFIFAERTGTIAIRPNGMFPLRAQGNGRFPLPGNTRANAWQGYLPFADRPEHKDPPRGFVASANQVTAAADFDYNYHGGFGEYRGRYINRTLRKAEQLTKRTMKELQLDSYNLLAEELAPLLIARINRQALTDEGSRILRLLSEWDYRCTAESKAATLFFKWQTKLYQLTFDEVPRDSGYLRPDLWRWNDIIAETPDDPIFDIDSTSFKETVATLTQRAFDEIVEELDGELPEPWAVARNTRIRHLGAIPGFGTGLISTDGSRQSPRALGAVHGASWRMVVELGDIPRAWGALPGGASGAPASPAYDNGVNDWANGRYHELTRWMNVEEAEQKAVGHWRFE
ncbi:MAG: penicillin acylase family protein, partial [Bacteroidota bacterium]